MVKLIEGLENLEDRKASTASAIVMSTWICGISEWNWLRFYQLAVFVDLIWNHPLLLLWISISPVWVEYMFYKHSPTV